MGRGKLPLAVLVLPLEDVPAAQLDSVRMALEQQHKARVHIGKQTTLPASASPTLRSPRYRADTLIAWLREFKPGRFDLIIGITGQDIGVHECRCARCHQGAGREVPRLGSRPGLHRRPFLRGEHLPPG